MLLLFVHEHTLTQNTYLPQHVHYCASTNSCQVSGITSGTAERHLTQTLDKMVKSQVHSAIIANTTTERGTIYIYIHNLYQLDFQNIIE